MGITRAGGREGHQASRKGRQQLDQGFRVQGKWKNMPAGEWASPGGGEAQEERMKSESSRNYSFEALALELSYDGKRKMNIR